MPPLLTVENVSKRYRLGRPAYGTFRDRLRRSREGAPAGFVTALDGVSLHVDAGETLALIGANGAGKSTLLKVVARITHPDAGTVRVRGRAAGLIEVGAGFHPELTGAENVLLHGSMIGLPARYWRERMDALCDFSGLGDRMDTAVKHYSTGMVARLGFSVAVYAEPDVLFVDEVLAVGDEAFRRKGLARIRALRAGGTAILWVSHDLQAVSAHADRVAWIDASRLAALGAPDEVVPTYRAAMATR